MRWPGDRGTQPKDLELKREGTMPAGRTREHPAARLREALDKNDRLMDENATMRGDLEDLREERRELKQRVADQQGEIIDLQERLREAGL